MRRNPKPGLPFAKGYSAQGDQIGLEAFKTRKKGNSDAAVIGGANRQDNGSSDGQVLSTEEVLSFTVFTALTLLRSPEVRAASRDSCWRSVELRHRLCGTPSRSLQAVCVCSRATSARNLVNREVAVEHEIATQFDLVERAGAPQVDRGPILLRELRSEDEVK